MLGVVESKTDVYKYEEDIRFIGLCFIEFYLRYEDIRCKGLCPERVN